MDVVPFSTDLWCEKAIYKYRERLIVPHNWIVYLTDMDKGNQFDTIIKSVRNKAGYFQVSLTTLFIV